MPHLTVSEDLGATPGHARISAAGVLPDGRPLYIRLETGDEPVLYLTPDGWRASSFWWPVARPVEAGDGCVFSLGPEITSWLPYAQVIRISFSFFPDGREAVSTVISWPAISCPPEVPGAGQRPRLPPAPDSLWAAEPAAPAGPAPPVPPLREAVATDRSQAVADMLHPEEEPFPGGAPSPTREDPYRAGRSVLTGRADAPRGTGRVYPMRTVFIWLVILSLVPAVLYWQRDLLVALITPPPPPVVAPDGASFDVSRFLSGRPSPEAAFAEAERLRRTGALGDALLIYSHAAEMGHAGAAYQLGRMYDPAIFDPALSPLPQPNVAEAHDWYLRAAEGGHPDAQYSLGRLLLDRRPLSREDLDRGIDWLRRAADNGVVEAAGFLERLSP